jgi:recombination protein RecA
MATAPAALRELLQQGAVRWARSVSRLTPAAWTLAELEGRVVELVADGPVAALTATVCLVREAQCAREPVAWIDAIDALFHAPDLAASGVDLDALAVVCAPHDREKLRAADELLRSGAFGLVVLDGLSFGSLSMAAQVRLSNLARQHDAVLTCLAPSAARRTERTAARSSLTSLRAEATRVQSAEDGFACRIAVTKDKRRGTAWVVEVPCDAPPGLY